MPGPEGDAQTISRKGDRSLRLRGENTKYFQEQFLLPNRAAITPSRWNHSRPNGLIWAGSSQGTHRRVRKRDDLSQPKRIGSRGPLTAEALGSSRRSRRLENRQFFRVRKAERMLSGANQSRHGELKDEDRRKNKGRKRRKRSEIHAVRETCPRIRSVIFLRRKQNPRGLPRERLIYYNPTP